MCPLRHGAGKPREPVLCFWVDGESFEPVGGLGKDGLVQTEAIEVVAQCGEVKIPVQPLEPPTKVLIMVNMVLSPSSLPLGFPSRKKMGFPVKGSVDFDVTTQTGAGRAIQCAKSA